MTVVHSLRSDFKSTQSDHEVQGFFRRICASTSSGRKPNLVMVCHAIGSLPPFLEALRQIADVSGILVKPKSAQTDILRRVSRFYHTEILSREICESAIKTEELLDGLTDGRDTILVDIGGYFCNVPRWKEEGHLQNIVGIVEDTENGHQRYAKSYLGDMPVMSVARSLTKQLEDWWVGRAIVFSAERQLRYIGETFHAKKITVLGFGKIGFSIADTLLRHGYDVSVYDIDPCKRVLAKCLNYAIPDREQAISSADVIFSATGNRALSLDDLDKKKRRTFVFSATSADDEFDIDFSRAIKTYGEFWQFPQPGGSKVDFFANRGNAINFIDGGEIGRYAHMVQSAIVHGVDAILCGEYTPGAISELSSERERLISSAYIDEFEGA
jgi:adenosylhomocysteinase